MGWGGARTFWEGTLCWLSSGIKSAVRSSGRREISSRKACRCPPRTVSAGIRTTKGSAELSLNGSDSDDLTPRVG